MSPFDRPPVDTVRERSVSFAPPSPGPAAGIRLGVHQLPVSEALGRPAIVAPTLVRGSERDEVNGYPIQLAKVQRPPLRDETLARERLLDWLGVKIHHRVVFVTAEAGYGKTTLLSDFSRRTRLRTLWYRLDDEDRNWVAFLSYLVAAGREYDPTFAEVTSGLLGELGTGGPTRESVTETFVREFRTLGDQGAVLVFDDYHVVDDSADVRYVVGELLARAPERITFVFSSRRQPSVRVARLRALGELAELTTDDLRFSEPETERLFRDIYHHPLEPDVLDDLSRRTEGWAASLQLVRAAIRDRSTGDVRRFVRSLSGAEGDLHDYLAEEVIGDLDPDLQDFVMKTSVLQSVNQTDASIVAGVDTAASRRLIAEAERHGLLGRRAEPTRSSQTYHPLVREFLEQRFLREAGAGAVGEAHLRMAQGSEGTDWGLACFHYAAAGRGDDIHRVLRKAIPTIMGTGKFGLAASFLASFPPTSEEFEFEVVRSRAEFQAGHSAAAFESAERALELEPDSDLAAINALSLRILAGNLEDARGLAMSLADSDNPQFRAIAAATAAMLQLSVDGNLSRFVSDVTQMAQEQGEAGFRHYEGVSLLNAASALKAQGEAEACLSYASSAIDLLSVTSAGHEVVSAKLIRAWALAHMARWNEATVALTELRETTDPVSRGEALTEMAVIELWYGGGDGVQNLLERAEPWLKFLPDVAPLWAVAAMERAIQLGAYDQARDLERRIAHGVLNAEPGLTVHALTTSAYLALRDGRADAMSLVGRAASLAEKQEARFWIRYCRALAAFANGTDGFAQRLRHAVEEDSTFLSILAELVTSRLADIDQPLFEIVAAEAARRPHRWRALLRLAIDGSWPARWNAGRLLDEVGDVDDIARLRKLARSTSGGQGDRSLGKSLARRLAPRVFVEDQGRVSIALGREVVPGTNVRRKVLALLCFLVSRQGFAATRDQVLDALWPDLEPAVALNSLNQTVYFLRRVFETEYQDDRSPGYVRHDSSLIWLDQELVSARSAQCKTLIQRAGAVASPDDVDRLSEIYLGRFALDFAYEEWAISYRDSLHAAYLQIMENAVSADTVSGHYERAINLARRALDVDPEADDMEVALLKLYRLAGAHSAAAEQYAHYANVIRREVGVEPPPLETL